MKNYTVSLSEEAIAALKARAKEEGKTNAEKAREIFDAALFPEPEPEELESPGSHLDTTSIAQPMDDDVKTKTLLMAVDAVQKHEYLQWVTPDGNKAADDVALAITERVM